MGAHAPALPGLRPSPVRVPLSVSLQAAFERTCFRIQQLPSIDNKNIPSPTTLTVLRTFTQANPA
jgi:hypothetical protein